MSGSRRSGRAGVRLRKARPTDLDRLVALDRATFGDHAFDRSQFRRYLRHPRAAIFVAVADGIVVGDLIVAARRGSKTGRIYSLVVDDRCRRTGIGRSLLRMGEAWCRKRRLRRILLEVEEGNDPARRLYESRGYEFLERLEHYYGRHRGAWRGVKSISRGRRIQEPPCSSPP